MRDGTVSVKNVDAVKFSYSIAGATAVEVDNDHDEDGWVTLETKLTSGQEIAVTSVGNGDNISDSTTATTKIYTAPATLATITVDDITFDYMFEGADGEDLAGKVIVSWNAVSGANKYEYILNGNEENATVISTNSVKLTLTDGVSSFAVRAIADPDETVADNGNYSDRYNSGKYALDDEDAILFAQFNVDGRTDDDDEPYTVAEILRVMDFYGSAAADFPSDKEFKVAGVVTSSTLSSGSYDIWLKNGDTTQAFEIYHAKASSIPADYTEKDALVNYTVTAKGYLTVYYATKEFKQNCEVISVYMADADKVKFATEDLASKSAPTPEITAADYTYTLPVEGLYGTKITWSFTGLDISDDGDDMWDDEEGTLVVTRPDIGADARTFTATATVSYGEGENKVESEPLTAIEFTVEAKGASVNLPKTATMSHNSSSTTNLAVVSGSKPNAASDNVALFNFIDSTSNKVTIISTIESSGGSPAIGLNKDGTTRIYANQSMIVTAAEGVTIVSIKLNIKSGSIKFLLAKALL